MAERDHRVTARGRVLDFFTIRGRGTAVVVDIIEGTWRSGSLIVCAKSHNRLRSVEFINGKNLPLTAIALLIDDDRIKQSVAVGEEVCTAPPQINEPS